MLRKLDFLGFTPQLYVKSENRYKTTLGGYLTILIAILSILALIGFGKNMLLKLNPTLYQNDVFSLENEIKFNDIPFAIGLMQRGGFTIPDLSRKLKVILEYSITNSSNKENPTIFIEYDMVPCSQTNLFKNDTLNIKKSLIGDPANFFCLPENLNLTWFGQYGNANFRVSRLFVKPCVNSTTNNSCLPLEEIQNNLSEFYAQYILVDTFCDLTSHDTPVTSYWRSDIISLSGYSSRYDQYTTKVINIQSDEGIIMETNNTLVSHQLQSKSALSSNYNSEFLRINTDISNIRTVLGRKYQKIQEVMANVGGFIKFIMLIFFTLNTFVTRFHFIEELYLRSFRKYEEFHKNIRLSNKDKIKETISTIKSSDRLSENTMYNNLNKNENEKIIHSPSIINSNSNHILKKSKGRSIVDKSRQVKYKKLNYTSFLCCKKNGFKTLKELDKNFISQVDIVKLFYMFKKFKLTENLIFGNTGQKLKNFLVYNHISEIEKNIKIKKEIVKKEFYDGLNDIKTTPRILDINKIMAVEIDKKILSA
jgi:hypothetical protein